MDEIIMPQLAKCLSDNKKIDRAISISKKAFITY